MKRPPLPETIRSTGVLAILRGLSAAETVATAHTLQEVGVQAVEVTLDSPQALDAIADLDRDPQLSVGAGTVRSLRDAERAVAAGASFLVAPDVQAEIVAWAAARSVAILPGAMTATEAHAAWRAGAAAVKLFPAQTLGPDHLRALRAPLQEVAFVPTGGVSGENVSAWFDAGAVAVAVGGWLTAVGDHDLLAHRGRILIDAARHRARM